MRRLSLVAVLACASVLLAACQFSKEGSTGPGEGVTANAVTGGPIEVTALDVAPGDGAAPATVAVDTAAPATAAPQAAPAAAEVTTEAAVARPPAEPAPKADLEEIPVTPKSDMQLACEKKKGKWAKIGKGDKRACVYSTRDSGKRCERESQCDGVCLARSGTCSPFKPLYGCNDILQDNGARVTLCLD
jgi:hypothetical protein